MNRVSLYVLSWVLKLYVRWGRLLKLGVDGFHHH